MSVNGSRRGKNCKLFIFLRQIEFFIQLEIIRSKETVGIGRQKGTKWAGNFIFHSNFHCVLQRIENSFNYYCLFVELRRISKS